MKPALLWMPTAILAFGALITVGLDGQRSMDLRSPLDHSVPRVISGQVGRDLEVSPEEQRVAGMTSFVMRVYSAEGVELDQTAAAFSVYVGYYASQSRGKTIHSPKNCLPGAGWQALASEPIPVETQLGRIQVNKYLLQRGEQKALVLYWYQGRGRIESNEYRVKWNLLVDSALRRRSDEALVRLVVPTQQNEAEAYRLATEVARKLVPIVANALPQA